jgi:tetratricopeptide (TPR) repeat protein
MERAADLLDRAKQSVGPRRDELATSALEHLSRASALMPAEPDPHYHRGLVYADFLHEARRAVEAWEQVRRLDPHYLHDPDMAFKLAIELSRLGQFGRAIAEYDRCLSYHSELARTDVVLGNSAEAAMGAGLLDDAIRRYRLALAAPAYDPSSTALHLFGLAVALDRDEQIHAAREVMRRALVIDPNRSSMETERGVFFVPEGDRLYYDALALEVGGQPAPARAAFEAFLTTLPQSPHAGRARAHLKDLARYPRPAAGVDVVVVGLRLTPPRPLEPIMRAIGRRLGELRACPTPQGLATVDVTLDADPKGRVGRVRAEGGPPPLGACARERIATWRLGPLGGRAPLTAAFTVVFSAAARTSRP